MCTCNNKSDVLPKGLIFIAKKLVGFLNFSETVLLIQIRPMSLGMKVRHIFFRTSTCVHVSVNHVHVRNVSGGQKETIFYWQKVTGYVVVT